MELSLLMATIVALIMLMIAILIQLYADISESTKLALFLSFLLCAAIIAAEGKQNLHKRRH